MFMKSTLNGRTLAGMCLGLILPIMLGHLMLFDWQARRDVKDTISLVPEQKDFGGEWVLQNESGHETIPDCKSVIPKEGWFYGSGSTLYYLERQTLYACRYPQLLQLNILGPEEAWGIGYSDNPSMLPLKFIHWKVSNWTEEIAPDFPQLKWTKGPEVYFNDIFFLSPDQGWAVGGLCGGVGDNYLCHRFFFQLNGDHWQSVIPPGVPMQDFPIAGIHMFSEEDGWLAAESNHLYHWNGDSWDEVFDENRRSFDLVINDLIALDTNNIWLFGVSGINSNGVIYHWDGVNWKEQFKGEAGSAIQSVSMANADFGWAVGGPFPDYGNGVIVQWNGKEWSPYPIEKDLTLFFVKTISENDAWALGSDRQGKLYIYRFVVKPALPPSPTPSQLPSKMTPSSTPELSLSSTATPIATPQAPSTQVDISTQNRNRTFLLIGGIGLILLYSVLKYAKRKR